MKAKPWWKSKTVWTNVAALLIAALAAGGLTGEPAPEVRRFIDALPFILTIVGPLVNLVLRSVTRQGIER
jgi:hypothetical protein